VEVAQPKSLGLRRGNLAHPQFWAKPRARWASRGKPLTLEQGKRYNHIPKNKSQDSHQGANSNEKNLSTLA